MGLTQCQLGHNWYGNAQRVGKIYINPLMFLIKNNLSATSQPSNTTLTTVMTGNVSLLSCSCPIMALILNSFHILWNIFCGEYVVKFLTSDLWLQGQQFVQVAKTYHFLFWRFTFVGRTWQNEIYKNKLWQECQEFNKISISCIYKLDFSLPISNN
jgi:hypothetical protein